MTNIEQQRKYWQKRPKNEPTDGLNSPFFVVTILPCFTLFHALRKQIFIQIVKIVALINIVIHIFPAWQIYRT